MSSARAGIAVVLSGAVTFVAVAAQAPRSPIDIRPVTVPFAIASTDGRTHLAYELEVTVASGASAVRLERVDVLGERSADPLSGYSGDVLDAHVMRPGAARDVRYGRSIAGGTTALIHMWVTLPKGEDVPRSLHHHFQLLGADGAEIPVGDVPMNVQRGPRVLGPPLRGGTWLAHNGPGNHLSPHWGSALLEDGHATIPQRFAIDFIGVDASGRAVRGDFQTSANEDWIGFGTDVLAVSDGIVREMQDGIADNAPLVEPPPPKAFSPAALYGNYVVLAIGSGVFAHYAHLQRNSVSVKVGQLVKRGQVIGRVGNSGNNNAPALHFHVADAIAFDNQQGLPFLFDSFDFLGETTADRAVGAEPPVAGVPASPSRHRRELPLDDAIIRFH